MYKTLNRIMLILDYASLVCASSLAGKYYFASNYPASLGWLCAAIWIFNSILKDNAKKS